MFALEILQPNLENNTLKAVILIDPHDVSGQCFQKDQKDEIISYS